MWIELREAAVGIGKRALTRVVETIKLIIMYKNELHNSDVWTHKIEEVSLTIEEFCIFIFFFNSRTAHWMAFGCKSAQSMCF